MGLKESNVSSNLKVYCVCCANNFSASASKQNHALIYVKIFFFCDNLHIRRSYKSGSQIIASKTKLVFSITDVK